MRTAISRILSGSTYVEADIELQLGLDYKTAANTATSIKSKLSVARTVDLIRLSVEMGIAGKVREVPVLVRRNFTKYFCDGFGLTLPQIGRRLLASREKIAATAAIFRGAHSAMTEAFMRRSRVAIDPVETGFLGQPDCHARRNPESRQAKTLFAGGSFVGRDPTGKQTGLRLMRSQGPA